MFVEIMFSFVAALLSTLFWVSFAFLALALYATFRGWWG